MSALGGANLVVRAGLEICALIALAYWGATSGSGITAWVLGLAAPAAFALLWGLLVSPKAKVRLPAGARFAVELVLFASASLAIAATGRSPLAVVFALVALVSGTINHVTR